MVFNFRQYFSYDEDLLRRVMLLVLLLVPVLMLLGRAAGDVAISTIAVSFLIFSAWHRDFSWLKARWVQAALLFWVFLVLNSLQAYDVKLSLERALPFIRYPIFAVAVSYWIIQQKRDLTFFVGVFVATIAFCVADGLFEYLFGFDFGGNEKATGRLSGPFKVSTLGIYLTKMGLPVLIAMLGVFTFQGRLQKIAGIILFLSTLVTISLAGERMALILMFFALVIMALFLKNNRKIIFGLIALLICVQGTIFYFSAELKDRMYGTVVSQIQENPMKSSGYKAQLYRAYLIAKDHTILGIGSNNFRKVCKTPKYDPGVEGNNTHCLIHPHQVYLELWVNNGLVGLCLFLAIIFSWVKMIWQVRSDVRHDYLLFGTSLGALLFLWPFSVGMSIFSNFNGALFWIMIAFMLASFQLRVMLPYGDRRSIGEQRSVKIV